MLGGGDTVGTRQAWRSARVMPHPLTSKLYQRVQTSEQLENSVKSKYRGLGRGMTGALNCGVK